MQTSSSPWLRDFTAALENKPRHGTQLSISDDSHHVTEAIGDMYGDEEEPTRHSLRPLSYISSPHNDSLNGPSSDSTTTTSPTSYTSTPLSRRMSRDRPPMASNGPPRRMPSSRSNSYDHSGPPSPSRSLRETTPMETANAHFPLNDVDYESSPAAVAQEMVNLQALRRMSMVDNAAGDPDLPSYAPMMPPVAPTGADDEDDTSRLFWVPARLHPELAPKEFKSFLETRVDQIKRRSGDEDMLSPDGMKRQDSGGGLRRKKSMLSRQIDNSGGKAADNYRDGAERLDRKRSSRQQDDLKVSDLKKLDVPEDASTLLRKLSLDSNRSSEGEVPAGDDMPILPAAPPSNSLRRSTRTTYRRGSLRKGERVPPSKRAARVAESEPEGSVSSGGVAGETGAPLSRASTEPNSTAEDHPANFSRPSLLGRSRGATGTASAGGASDELALSRRESDPVARKGISKATFAERAAAERALSANGRSDPPIPKSPEPPVVPRIIETPPAGEDEESSSTTPSYPKQAHIPERVSSHEPPPSLPPTGPLPPGPPKGIRQNRGSGGTTSGGGLIRQAQNPSRNGNQTLNDIVGQPSPLPGNSTRTDSLSFIPTFSDEKKEKKAKERKEKDSHHEGSKKSGWGWLLGSEEKDRDKDKDKETTKKGKSKAGKSAANDNTRLDLLQTSIDGGRGRESLVLDRESVKLEEERKKESLRKTSGEGKKEKDSGLFSSFFGGGKKKGDRDERKRDRFSRGLSPEPPHRELKPDVDYNWTRFSILEERAIYRMAHIKLANPRRALYSQVLLSNFMYSYLAKVQEMHPQIQIPQTAAQKQQQSQQQQQQQSSQQSPRHQSTPVARGAGGGSSHSDQEQQHRADSPYYQYHDQPAADNQSVNYVDDSQIYNYDHSHAEDGNDSSQRPQSRATQHGTESSNGAAHGGGCGKSGGYDYHFDEQGKKVHVGKGGKLDADDDDDDDMW